MAPDPDLVRYGYLGSDTFAYFRIKDRTPSGQIVDVDLSDYTDISLAMFEPTVKKTLGRLVCEIKQSTHSALFLVDIANRILGINISKLPDGQVGPIYEGLLKLHSVQQPDGQVIADPKQNNSLPTLFIVFFPGAPSADPF